MKLCLVGVEPTNKCFKMTFCFLCTLYDVGQFSKHVKVFFFVHSCFTNVSYRFILMIIFMILGWLNMKLIVM